MITALVWRFSYLLGLVVHTTQINPSTLQHGQLPTEATIMDAWPVRIRPASMNDLHDIVNISIAASSMEPQFSWKYPHREQYPQDTYEYARRDYLNYIENSENRWLVMLAETSKNYTKNGQIEQLASSEMTTIAVSVWETSALPPAEKSRWEHEQLLSSTSGEHTQHRKPSCLSIIITTTSGRKCLLC